MKRLVPILILIPLLGAGIPVLAFYLILGLPGLLAVQIGLMIGAFMLFFDGLIFLGKLLIDRRDVKASQQQAGSSTKNENKWSWILKRALAGLAFFLPALIFLIPPFGGDTDLQSPMASIVMPLVLICAPFAVSHLAWQLRMSARQPGDEAGRA